MIMIVMNTFRLTLYINSVISLNILNLACTTVSVLSICSIVVLFQ